MNVKVTVKDLGGKRVLAEMTAESFEYALRIVHHPWTWQNDKGAIDRVMTMVDEFRKTGSTVLASRSRGLLIRFIDMNHVPEKDKL